MTNHHITVEWTGGFPGLCVGEWIIHIDSIKLTGLEGEEFNTHKEYVEVNVYEEWKTYEDGLEKEEWITELKTNDINGLMASLTRHGIPVTDELLSELYDAINEKDWRRSSCGGCV